MVHLLIQSRIKCIISEQQDIQSYKSQLVTRITVLDGIEDID